MARYKKYKYGGKRIPGMFKRQEGGEEQMSGPPSASGKMEDLRNVITQQQNMPPSTNMSNRQELVNLSLSNAMKENQLQQGTMVNKKMTEMIMQMKLQNQSLEQQNQLLKTQIEKSDLINSARNVKQKPGASNTPKKRGGSVKAKKGKEKMMFFAQSNGGTMKHGGSCGGPLVSMMKRGKRK